MEEFTIEEFKTEICRFRNLFGNKEFMTGPEQKRDAAVAGLTLVYFNTKTKSKEDESFLQNTFKNTMTEYIKRLGMIARFSK